MTPVKKQYLVDDARSDSIGELLHHLHLRCVARVSHLGDTSEIGSVNLPAFYFVAAGNYELEEPVGGKRDELSAGDLLLAFRDCSLKLNLAPNTQPAEAALIRGEITTGLSGLSGTSDPTTIFSILPTYKIIRRTSQYQLHLENILSLLVTDESRASARDSGLHSGLQNISMMNISLSLILTDIVRNCLRGSGIEDPWVEALKDDEIGPVLCQMLRNPESDWSVESLAASGYMSRATFARKFREIVGESPMEVLATIRMRIACEMLRAGKAIKEISRRSGYRSISAFTVAFRKRFGVTPHQYRVSDEPQKDC